MEKRISFPQFQSVRSVAKAIDPLLTQKSRFQAQIDALESEFQEKAKAVVVKMKTAMDEKKAKLEEEINSKDVQINALEAGIVQIIGFHVGDLVKKVIEPTGKTDKNGRPLKETKYLPTDIVSYDSATKQYVISTSDDSEEQPEAPTEEPVEETAEEPQEEEAEEAVEEEASEEEEAEESNDDDNQMPWE